MDFVINGYNKVFYEKADPRVKDWFLLTSPMPVFFICLLYLAIIKIILPKYMKNRPAYSLKTVIKWYNIVQIVANAIVVWGILTSGWTTTYHLGCLLPDYSNDPIALRMLFYLWCTIILKLIELIETCFFILRKRERQASFLHVYHHITTVWVIWSCTKYVGGGMTTFTPLLNNSVHVIMYSYYLGAAEGGPKLRQILTRWKKWLTVIQMLQFTFMFVHGCQVFLPSCPAPKGITYIYFPNLVVIFYLFSGFYEDNYKKVKSK